MKRFFFAALAMVCGTTPALAADYYVAAHFTSANGDGESELLVNAVTVHATDEGYKAAEIASVNAGGTATSTYTAQFDCAAKSWRVTNQNDYYVAQQMAPVSHATREVPGFTPVSGGTPAESVMILVCGWPAGIAGATKIVAPDAIALSKTVSPTLHFTPPPPDRR